MTPNFLARLTYHIRNPKENAGGYEVVCKVSELVYANEPDSDIIVYILELRENLRLAFSTDKFVLEEIDMCNALLQDFNIAYHSSPDNIVMESK
jgi:hypothetical protein